MKSIAVLIGILGSGLALAAPAQLELQQKLALRELQVRNLAGNVTIVRSGNDQFEISARVVANAEPAAAAERLARSVRLDVQGKRLDVTWPTSTYSSIYTPEAPDVIWPLRATIRYLDRKVILTRDRADGADLRVDLRIGVPPQGRLEVENHLGYVHAEGLDGQLDLKTSTGTITSERTRGALEASTGSSDIHVAFHRGKLSAETGSGRVRIDGSDGELEAETGTGDIRVARSRGSLEAETGTGDISVEVFAGSLNAATGTGDIRTAEISGVTQLDAAAGSGDVYIDGDLAALQEFAVATGAGDVTVISSTEPSLRLSVETGLGELTVTGPAPTRDPKDEDDAEDSDAEIVTLGRGTVEGSIATGSGDVTLKFPTAAGMRL